MVAITRMFGGFGMVVLSLGLVGSSRAAENLPAPIKERTTIDIGMPGTLFQGMPKWIITAGAEPFKKMMKEQTGLAGTIHFPTDALMLADQMKEGKVQLGVFQGHEFAWARNKNPDLMPIAVAVPMQPVQSFCLVKWDCKAKNIGDLKGEKISLPPVHRDYCELFLARQKDLHMKGAKFAGQIDADVATNAIQDVIDDKAGCTIVDGATWHFFQKVFPGAAENLKVLCESEVFPNACIAIQKSELDDKTIEKFRKAMLNAQNDTIGRPMLTTWKLTGFAKVPDNYEQQIKTIGKTYPVPPALRVAVDK